MPRLSRARRSAGPVSRSTAVLRRAATLGRSRRAARRRVQVLKVCEDLDGVVGLLPGLGLELGGELS